MADLNRQGMPGYQGGDTKNRPRVFRIHLVGQDSNSANVTSKINAVHEVVRAETPDAIRRRGRFGGGYNSTR